MARAYADGRRGVRTRGDCGRARRRGGTALLSSTRAGGRRNRRRPTRRSVESPAARIADVATSDELATRYEGWDNLTVVERGRLLKVFRIFVEECPVCGGTVSVEQEEVESCCRSFDVVASTCDACEARILEQELTD